MIIATGRNESSVGVGILDCDHRELHEAFRELHAEIATGWKRSQVGHLLRGLTNFSLLHFALEEGMMEAVHYPMLNRHRTHHRHMMQEMNLVVSLYLEDGVIPDHRWLSSVATSTNTHVEVDDLYFGSWLGSN